MREVYLRYFLSLSTSVDVFGGQTFVFTALLYHLSPKKGLSRILPNMKAYVIVRGLGLLQIPET